MACSGCSALDVSEPGSRPLGRAPRRFPITTFWCRLKSLGAAASQQLSGTFYQPKSYSDEFNFVSRVRALRSSFFTDWAQLSSSYIQVVQTTVRGTRDIAL